MIDQDGVLVQLLRLVERIPTPPPPRSRGRPVFYPERLFVKALVIMIVRRLHKVGELLAVLEEPTPEMRSVRELLKEGGRFPSFATAHLREEAQGPAARDVARADRLLGAPPGGVAEALGKARESGGPGDSTVLRAKGGVWHKKDREAGLVPHSSIDTEAGWTYSGWHGWVYGWKLHLAVTVAGVWIPLSARLTPANAADSRVAPPLIEALPEEARFVLGDTHYDAKDLREACLRDGRFLVSTKRGPYPHTDQGVEVRRIFHELRSRAIENFNGQFKSIFDGNAQVPTKGLVATARFALGAVLVYQLALLHRYAHERDLRVGLKAFLKAA